MPQAPKLQPALFGGLFIGVLSALPLVNACCCLWILAGGVLAVYLMQSGHPYPISAADGAVVGLLAGMIGAIISGLLAIPINMAMGPVVQRIIQGLLLNNPDIPAETKSAIENMLSRSGASVIGTILGIGFGMIVGAIFGALGGLLGVAMFKKNAPPPPPPGTVEILPPA
jgi:hypothetical protein